MMYDKAGNHIEPPIPVTTTWPTDSPKNLTTITERIEEDFTRKFVDYFDDGSKKPDLKLFYLLKSFLVASVAGAWKEGYKAGRESQEQALWEATSKLQ